MENVTITDIYGDSGRIVSKAHFGGNTLYTRNTENGIPDENYMIAVDELDIGYLRYPAGHPDVAYIDGMVIDGQLPEHLANFMETAKASGHKVLIVTPSHAAYSDAAEVGEFAALLATQYPETVHAFEIGNEYFRHQTETSYGQVANNSVLAISGAIDALNIDIPIWVQMAEASGFMSEFHSTNDERGWVTRTVEANQTIIDQLSDEARAEIDGVVEHFYLRGNEGVIDPYSQDDQMLSLDLAMWRTTLGEDITFAITEWNVKVSNLNNLGVKAASSLIAHFTHIVDLDADEAYIWPPHLNTASDLAGSGEVLTDPSTGVVINSVGGAIFDLMSTQLPGLELIPASWSFGYDMFHTVYGSEDRVVVYVASRSDEIESISFSLGEWFGETILVSATQIGYDRESSNGRHYNYETDVWDDSESLIVNGEAYYVNEHDVRANVTELDVTPSPFNTPFEITLLPYEVVELVYEIPQYIEYTGSNLRDVVATGDDDDLIQLLGGDDSVTSGSGSDTIFGGNGDDYLNSGADADSVEGGQGDDSLRGWGGDDTLIGGEGNDNLQGWSGADYLAGSSGDDQLLGGGGNDVLVDGIGADYIDAGDGDDSIFIEGTNSIQLNQDVRNLRTTMSENNLFEVHVSDHASYAAVIDGGNGFDVVNFGDLNDAFFLHDNFSAFNESIQQLPDSSSHTGRARFSGIEEINLGAGNDVLDLSSYDYTTGVDTLRVFGQSGNDIIWGSSGDEHIFGGSGSDVIYGGGGFDLIRGGNGADTFYVSSYSTETTILDFDYSEGDIIIITEEANFQLSGHSFINNGASLLLLFENNLGEQVSTVQLDLDGDYESMDTQDIASFTSTIGNTEPLGDTFVFEREDDTISIDHFETGIDMIDLSGLVGYVSRLSFDLNGGTVQRVGRFEENDYDSLTLWTKQIGEDLQIFAEYEVGPGGSSYTDHLATLTNTSESEISLDDFLF